MSEPDPATAPQLPVGIQPASEIRASTQKKIMLVGPPGAGKTVAYSTLPGRTLVYLFDPNAQESLIGSKNIDFYQTVQDHRSFDIITLKGGGKNYTASTYTANRDNAPKRYDEWEKVFQTHLEQGVLDSYDNIGIDSLTMMQYAIMDMTQHLNNRPGRMPEQDDYGPVMHTFMMIWQTLTEMSGKNIFCTAHEEYIKVHETLTTYTPLLYGKLKQRLPILFTDIYRFEVDNGKFLMRTISDSRHRYVRCSFRDVQPEIDWTIKDWDRVDRRDYGLGGLLQGKYHVKTK